MTFTFILRLIFGSIIRFVGLIALILWYQNFEVSPLPAWTLDAALLVAQFLWTFLTTRWVLHHHYPTRRMMIVLVSVFLIGQIILELWLTKRLTGNTWGGTIGGALQWGALIQIALHSAAIYLGYRRSKNKLVREQLTEAEHLAKTN